MELSDLKYFNAAAECGNFTGAARLLELNISTISRSISQLEDELGISLFERTTTGVRLTKGGEDVLRYSRGIERELHALRVAVALRANASAGEIALGVRGPAFGEQISGLLRDWRVAHPAVGVTMMELDDRDIAGAIIGRRLDVVFAPSFNLWPQSQSLPVYRERFIAALPADHPLAALDSVSWSSFEGATILIQAADDNDAKRQFFAPLLSTGARFQPHASTMQSILGLVGSGFGVALAQAGMACAQFPNVVFRPIEEPDAEFEMHLAWHPEAEDPVVGRFVAFVRDRCRELSLI